MFRAYWTLSRFHKPAGTLLLWAPTAWALWIANQGRPSWSLLLLFLAGTIVMRAAGCVINDMADSRIDAHVQRTKNRPLAAGTLRMHQAMLLLLFYLSLALLILLQLPSTCVYYAAISLFVTILYPFCKRYIEAPQVVLGLAFSMSIPMVYAASQVAADSNMFLLLVINFLWILAYDTQYAMSDRPDDLRIGVKSTAILMGRFDTLIIGLLQVGCQALWLLLALRMQAAVGFYIVWFLAGFILIHQQRLLRERDRNACLQAFSTNSWYGMAMWAAVMLA